MSHSTAASAVTSVCENSSHIADSDEGAAVLGSDLGWGDGLRSPSARSSASQLDVGCDLVLRDPDVLMRGLLSCGVSTDAAVRLLEAYYKAAVPSESSESVTQESVSTTMSAKQRRLMKWREETAALPEVEGQCYLHVVRWSRRSAFLSKLGPCPLLRDFVSALEPRDLLVSESKSLSVFRMRCNEKFLQVKYHIADSCEYGERVGSVYAVVASMLRTYPFLNSVYKCEPDTSVGQLPLVGCVGASSVPDGTGDVGVAASSSLDGYVAMVKAPVRSDSFSALRQPGLPDERSSVVVDEPSRYIYRSEALESLAVSDMSSCFCKIHQRPLTSDPRFSAQGCCKRLPGGAGVIANAFKGVSRMCHADEATRAQDSKLLELVLSKDDPGVLDGKARPGTLERLCTSSVSTDIAAFGNGYCYLVLLSHDTWWRAARLLGPNPTLMAFSRVFLWLGRPASKLHTFVKVRDGYYHVVPVKSAKGVDSFAGVKAYRDLQVILDQDPNARVGAESNANGLLPASYVNFVTPAFAILIACASMLVTITCLIIRLSCARDRSRYR